MEKIFSAKVQEITSPQSVPGDNLCFTLCFDSNDALMEEHRGKLFAVLDVSSKTADKESLNSTASLILTTLKESYYGDLEGTPIQALERAVQLAKEKANTLQNYALDLNLVASVLWGKVLYTAQFGSGVAYIIRNRAVLDAVKQSLGDAVISSGIVEKEDVLILATPEFTKLFTKENIVEGIGKMNDSVFMSSGGKVAVVVVRFDTAEKWGKENAIKFSLPAKMSNKNFLLSKIFKEREVVVSAESLELRSKKKRLVLATVAILASLVLGFSAWSSFKSNKGKEAQVSPSGDKVTGEVILNSLRDRLSKAKESLDSESSIAELKEIALSKAPEGISSEEFGNVLGEATSLLEESKNIVIARDPKVVYEAGDTSLSNPRGLFVGDAGLVIWSNDAYAVEGSDGFKKTDLKSLSVGAEGGVSYFIDSMSVKRRDLKSADSKDFALPASIDAEKIISSKAYFQNIYLLTKDGGVSKLNFDSETAGYSLVSWLKQEGGAGGSVDIAIDGNVYALLKNGGIKKFYIGEEQTDFVVKELPYSFFNPVAIYTNVDLNEIYILDAGDSSITLLDKTGKYLKKIIISTNDTVDAVSALAINDTDKKAFVLMGTKVVEVDL